MKVKVFIFAVLAVMMLTIPAYAADEVSGECNMADTSNSKVQGASETKPGAEVSIRVVNNSKMEIFLDSKSAASKYAGSLRAQAESDSSANADESPEVAAAVVETTSLFAESPPSTSQYRAPRCEIAQKGGYRYTWCGSDELDILTELYHGDKSWSMPGLTKSDMSYIASKISEVMDNNPYFGKPQKHTFSSKGVVSISEREYTHDYEDMALAVDAKVDLIYSQLDDGIMSDMDLALAYASWLRMNADYDYTCYNWINEHENTDGSIPAKYVTSLIPYGVLNEGKGVCSSYAQSLMLLLRRSGIKAFVRSGFLPDDDEKHQWVIAEIDGKWKFLDPTSYEAGQALELGYAVPSNAKDYKFAIDL